MRGFLSAEKMGTNLRLHFDTTTDSTPVGIGNAQEQRERSTMACITIVNKPLNTQRGCIFFNDKLTNNPTKSSNKPLQKQYAPPSDTGVACSKYVCEGGFQFNRLAPTDFKKFVHFLYRHVVRALETSGVGDFLMNKHIHHNVQIIGLQPC